ncbi:MAG: cation-translocating P-type ATPase [Bacteroidetes bacterium]|nr:cation-translocating P-type ATPase [Bacteroidota bacterium]
MDQPTQNITLHIEGMDCANCAMGITKSLQKSGMENVHVDFATGEAAFYLKDKNTLQPAIKSVQSLGYKVIDSKLKEENEGKLSTIEKRFYLTLPFTVILFFSHMIFSHEFILNQPLVQLILCIPVFIIGIMQFGKSALGSVRIGVPNMDVLIFIGSSSAFIYSLAGMYLYDAHEAHNYLFFETTATIISLVLLGNVLEHRSVKQTTSAIKELSALSVSTAKIVGLQFGKEVISEISYKDIPVGAILQVNTGDKIPVDGEIISGEASIDEAMLTGESIPVEKTISDKVIGGTILLAGNFRMRAEKVGNDTTLSKIIDLVKKAQQAKPNIQKLGDKISAIFVPVVLGISIITFCVAYFAFHIILQDALMRSIAILVISCPCAMGLATPTAVMVGIGRAAKKGILIKGGNTLEEFAKIKRIVFDKTGTLTTGEFLIKNLVCYNSNEQEVKDILFQLEQHSSHPIAKSIVKELKGSTATKVFSSITEEKGQGITATDAEKNEYMIGSYRIAKHLTKDDSHNVYILKNDSLIASLDLADELKINVKESITFLKASGINSVLLSGDSSAKCNALAEKAGIVKVYSEQSPSQKLEIIEQLNSEMSTAMVGDGINDAPALAKATVGISLSNATQVAIQSAQIILLKNNDLSSLAEAHLISKHTLITIKQNLFWAFFYNIVAIPIAASGFLNPMVGALAMAFSDIIVIGNSIRLKTKKLN